ncbi:MAG: BlaI/MecI/CopY family transcriptional regulator [Gemmatimonadales bacterium]|nr:BlaI/MecI/CopY family transcriptional regulator [Gemmatimonadales bacterium]
MPRPPSPTLTPAELRVMKAMWKRGSATASEVVELFCRGTKDWKDSTVRTMLRILERKGYLRQTKDGRALVYTVVIDETQARRGVVRDLIARFFDDSPERLVLNVLEHEDLDRAELARLKRLVQGTDKP